MYIHMDTDMIAIILYICILIMAAAVAGMTIVYFIKPGASRTSRASIAERNRKANQVGQESDMTVVQSTAAPVKTVEVIPAKMPNTDSKPAVEVKKESPKAEPINQKEKTSKNEVLPQPKPVEKLAAKPELKKEETKIPAPAVSSKTAAPAPKPTANVAPAMTVKAAELVKTGTVVKTTPEVKTEVKNTAATAKPEPEKPKAVTPEKPKPAPVENKTDTGNKGTQPNSLGDLSKMFSKDVAEETEASKLAKNLKDVDIKDLVKDSKDLISFLKQGRSQ